MRWWVNVATSLLIAAATAIVLAGLQPVVEKLEPSNRIRADIVISQWVDRPIKDGRKLMSRFANPVFEQARLSLFEEQGLTQMANMRIQNPGKEIVTSIRLRFPGKSHPRVTVESNDGLAVTTYVTPSIVNLPDMEPGDIVKLYAWSDSGFYPATFQDEVLTYSSQGPFDIHLQSLDLSDAYQRYGYIFDFSSRVFVAALLLALPV